MYMATLYIFGQFVIMISLELHVNVSYTQLPVFKSA